MSRSESTCTAPWTFKQFRIMDPAQTILLSYFVPAQSVFLIYNGSLSQKYSIQIEKIINLWNIWPFLYFSLLIKEYLYKNEVITSVHYITLKPEGRSHSVSVRFQLKIICKFRIPVSINDNLGKWWSNSTKSVKFFNQILVLPVMMVIETTYFSHRVFFT